jgi:DNA-binding phage protein
MHETLARELVRALRGKRSQPALCRRIGLRSNLVYRWEAGRAWPTARQLFRIGRAVGIPAPARLANAFRSIAGLGELELETPAGVSALLRSLVGSRGISELAEKVGRSRFVVSRWLTGKTDIKLPDFLRVVEVTTFRLADFVAALANPLELPSLRSDWMRLEAARAAAYDAPWSHAVLRALELEGPTRASKKNAAWVAARLGIPRAEVDRSVALLLRSGQIRLRAGELVVAKSEVVETGGDLERRTALRSFWARAALERLERGVPGVHAFNLFTLANADVPKLRELQIDFFNRLRALASESSPAERVFVYAAQIVPLE